jgi:hypothetical protein
MDLEKYIEKNVANDAVGHVLRQMAKELKKLQVPSTNLPPQKSKK